MAPERVTIKGTSKGVIVTIGAGNWKNTLRTLAQKLEQKSSFFKGGRVAVSVGDRLLNADEITAMGELLTEHHMTLWAVRSNAEETQQAAISLGLEAEADTPKTSSRAHKSAMPNTPGGSTEVVTIRRTLRSGQTIETLGNVVIIGDVNPGAQIKAGGYVIIWGRLRGSVIAGAVAPENAFVCALELKPVQLIIGNAIARAPADDRRSKVIPEIAFVQDGQIVAEAWG